MLHTLAEQLTDCLYRHCSLDQSKRPILIYGTELGLSTLMSISSIILLSLLFQAPYSSFSFLGIFFFLRLFAGGYHAPTYLKCFILTNVVYLLTYALAYFVIFFNVSFLLPLIATMSGIIIFLLAPIKSKKHPLSEKRYKRNKTIARIMVATETVGMVGLYFSKIPTSHLAVPVLSLAAVAAMMIITLFERG